jgi:hypothetical protein
VYSGPINGVEMLLQRVSNAYQEIRVKPGILERKRTSARQLCRHAREQHRAPVVEKTRTPPISWRTLVLGHADPGFAFISVSTAHPESL